MPNVLDNMARLAQAISDATSHCMCLRHQPGLIIFPEGYPIDGVRFPASAAGYEWVLAFMEQTWLESLPANYREQKP